MNFIDIDLKNNICSDEYIIGYQGESYVSGIRFILPYELADWNAFIDLETANGDKTRYEIVDIENNTITYEFTAVDLKYSGKLTLNLVLVKDRQILKPYVGEFIVKEAICAEKESSENVPIILSSNLSNEIHKNIKSRHEHLNIDVLNRLAESDDGSLVYNGNPISGSVSEECDPSNIPTKTSQLENDSGYITVDDLPADELPTVTEADNGKVLRVVDGVWNTDKIPERTFKKLLDYTVPEGETLGVGVYKTDMFVIENISVSELIFSLTIPAISSFPTNASGEESKSGLSIFVTEDGETFNDIGSKIATSSHASNISYIIVEYKFLPGGFVNRVASGYDYNGPNITTSAWASSGLKKSTLNGIVTGLKFKEGYPKGQILPSGTRLIIYGR